MTQGPRAGLPKFSLKCDGPGIKGLIKDRQGKVHQGEADRAWVVRVC